MQKTLNNSNLRQSDTNKKYSATHLLLKGEEDLKNYNSWIVNKFIKNAPEQKDLKVMDFGAGVATLAEIYFRSTGIKPECVELDPAQREIIEQRGYKAHSGLDQLTGKYDLIYTSNVLEHIEDDVKTLVSIKSKLSKTGTLVIFVPAFKVLWSSMDDRVGHCRRYSKVMLAEKLAASGYTIKFIRYCDSVGFALTLLFKYIGNKSGEPSSASLRVFDIFLLPISKLVDVLIFGIFGKNLIAIASLNEASEARTNV